MYDVLKRILKFYVPSLQIFFQGHFCKKFYAKMKNCYFLLYSQFPDCFRLRKFERVLRDRECLKMSCILEILLLIFEFHPTYKSKNAFKIDNGSLNQRREILYPEYWQPFKEFVTSHGFSPTTKA